ncbi:MAG: hypothetical protein IV086_07900 [Hyphomonadaceae bacterium]|nr:hypothetical protein [Hyphomonadaceae bacterium]
MTQAVLIFAAEADVNAAQELANAIGATGEMSPVVCPTSAGRAQLSVGEGVTSVAVWSAQARSSDIFVLLNETISQHPRASLIWRLDDTPWPAAEALDPGTMLVGPAPDGVAAATRVALLTARRASARPDDAAAPIRTETPAWPAIALGVLIAGGLATAGYSAWRDAPPARRPTVAAPLSPAAAAPPAAAVMQQDIETPPETVVTSNMATVLPNAPRETTKAPGKTPAAGTIALDRGAADNAVRDEAPTDMSRTLPKSAGQRQPTPRATHDAQSSTGSLQGSQAPSDQAVGVELKEPRRDASPEQ